MSVRYERVLIVEHDESQDELGEWCRDCNLPSAVVLHFAAVMESGVFPDVATCRVCLECGSEDAVALHPTARRGD